MEAESGAKIAIRGKGSVKEGKGRSDPSANSSLEEDLHCLVMADTEDKVRHAIKLIESIIETVKSRVLFCIFILIRIRRHLFLRNRMILNDNNCVTLQCLTVHFVTTKTKFVKIVYILSIINVF